MMFSRHYFTPLLWKSFVSSCIEDSKRFYGIKTLLLLNLVHTHTHTHIYIYIYIYIYNYYYYYQVILTTWNSRILFCTPSLLSFTSRLHPVSVKSLHKQFLLLSKRRHIHIQESIRKRRICVRLSFLNSASHILIVLLGWFTRWEAGGRIAAGGCYFKNLFKISHSILL